MARTGFFHHVGSFLLLAATILLVVTTVSAPVISHTSFLTVRLSNATAHHKSALTFGTFGYCVTDTAGGRDACSAKHVGYDAVAAILRVDGEGSIAGRFSASATSAAKTLSRIMVLHPVAAGVAAVAFLLTIGAGLVGSFLSSLVSLLAFAATALVLITDFVLFRLLSTRINGSDSGATHATYGAAIWVLLAAAVCLLLSTIVTFFTCCSAHLHHKSKAAHKASPKEDPA